MKFNEIPDLWRINSQKTPQGAFLPLRLRATLSKYRLRNGCGRSSGVEHNLAKVRVESSNLFARSSFETKGRLEISGLVCF